jgi:hypothetical protein
MPIPPPPNLRDFTSPLEWPQKRKYLITTLSCGVTVLAGYAAGAYSPPQAELAKAWKVSGTVYNLGITAYTLGFAIASMVLAPFSEVIGKGPSSSPVVFCSLVTLLEIPSAAIADTYQVCQICCGVTAFFEVCLWRDSGLVFLGVSMSS